MDTPIGLLVPVIKGIQSLTVLEIAAELNRLQEVGMRGSLTSNDMTGATFTLSNIGSVSLNINIVSLYFIINL